MCSDDDNDDHDDDDAVEQGEDEKVMETCLQSRIYLRWSSVWLFG